MWVGISVGSCFVLLLALALAVLCHPPLLARLPTPLVACFTSVARLGRTKAAAVAAGTATANGGSYDSVSAVASPVGEGGDGTAYPWADDAAHDYTLPEHLDDVYGNGVAPAGSVQYSNAEADEKEEQRVS